MVIGVYDCPTSWIPCQPRIRTTWFSFGVMGPSEERRASGQVKREYRPPPGLNGGVVISGGWGYAECPSYRLD